MYQSNEASTVCGVTGTTLATLHIIFIIIWRRSYINGTANDICHIRYRMIVIIIFIFSIIIIIINIIIMCVRL